MIVHKGRMDPAGIPQTTALYHVRTHAVQVVARTASLNSNDAFLLRTPSHLYLWCGSGAPDTCRSIAQQIAQVPLLRGARKYVEVNEDSETGIFPLPRYHLFSLLNFYY